MELIKDVLVKQLRIIPDERGFLMEIMRADWPEFINFAQSYVTACYPGVYKAWHYHEKQWDHFSCVEGMVRLALYDAREGSPTGGKINVFHMGCLNPVLVRIPPLVYHGFAAEGGRTALLINFPTELYHYKEPDEFRLPWNDPSVPYDWEAVHK
ncbi:MAG: dTDP-4-dehydrorhamnose 3,5-epimerase family protein [Firmicutes bacterium]|nr:dTDP-4-dehydrorhamnose 3,5-epimerase family protein [Bacillota bacterium]